MILALAFLSRRIPKASFQLFNPKGVSTKHLTNIEMLRRHISTEKWEFSDEDKGISGVFHHTIKAHETDHNFEEIANKLNELIASHPNSLFFLTDKSRLLKRESDENPNHYVPIREEDLLDIDFMLSLSKKKNYLRPYGGHTCMAITNSSGEMLEETHVSLRPSKSRILTGKSALHPTLYPTKLPGSVNLAKHTTIPDEINELARKMILDKRITADLTVIPLAQTSLSLEGVLENIKSAKTLKLYNLFSLIVEKKDIELITDADIRSYVEELKVRADEFPSLRENATDTNSVLAALACVHAIAKATFGDAYALDRAILPDQDTQTATVYCTIALLGTRKFLEFAKEINFYNASSDLTKPKP